MYAEYMKYIEDAAASYHAALLLGSKVVGIPAALNKHKFIGKSELEALKAAAKKSNAKDTAKDLDQKLREIVLVPKSMDPGAALDNLLKGSGGVRGGKFDEAFKSAFGIAPKDLRFNRSWRLIFVAPGFSFRHNGADWTNYLSKLAQTGKAFEFLEYRLVEGGADEPRWTLAWRWDDSWYQASEREASPNKDETARHVLDEFEHVAAKRGVRLKRWASYCMWDVGGRADVAARWPGHPNHPNDVVFQVPRSNDVVELRRIALQVAAKMGDDVAVTVSPSTKNIIVHFAFELASPTETAGRAASIFCEILVAWDARDRK